MKIDAIKGIDGMARERFTYRPDPEKKDRWFSYHDYVLRGEQWADDCDSLASTVVNLLLYYRMPLEKAWFLHVDSDYNTTIDHMIAIVEDDDSKLWVVGDTFGRPYPAESMQHRLKTFCRVSSIMDWYEVTHLDQLRMV